MFHQEFFPTPPEVIEKMLEPYKRTYKENYAGNTFDTIYYNIKANSILEPSAGKGDIMDFMKKQGRHNTFKFYCIESDPELQLILQGKQYRLIDNDFLNYNGDYLFDLIIMNPPFSNGDEHLLKAWNILEDGDIICLLNAETIKNPYSKKRQLLKYIIETNGSVEYLGNCFSTADRTTNVEIALVRLTKKAAKKVFDFEFESVTNETHFKFDQDTINNHVTTRDVVGNMIIQYTKLKAIFIDYMKASEALIFYSQGLLKNSKKMDSVLQECMKGDKNSSYNNFCDIMKEEIWSVVINQMGMERYMTSNVLKNFNQFVKNQGSLDFTKENVQALINMLLENGSSILDQVILDVFDLFTAYHAENRLIQEGWKTNDKWKVNKKIILPYVVSMGYGGFYQANIYRSSYNDFKDIDKAMCYIAGKKYEDFSTLKKDEKDVYGTPKKDHNYLMTSIEQAIERTPIGSTKKTECEFFEIRCYKKGTLHLYFKDERLWQEFNMRACSGKNWLPEDERKDWEKTKPKPHNPNLLLLN